MSPPVLRPARPEDAAAAAAVQLDAALTGFAGIFPPEAPAPTLASLTAQWADRLAAGPGWAAFVAEEAGAVPGGSAPAGGTVVGVVFAGPDPDEPTVGHVGGLYVVPPCWGLGTGRRLHDRALDHLAGLGFGEATLWALERNTRTRGWYERLGWRPTPARKPVYAPAGVVDVGYRRVLPTATDR